MKLGLMSVEVTFALSAAWAAVWFAAHCLCGRPAQAAYERRLRRSQLFACLASLGALHLLWAAQRWPEDLLFEFSLEHQSLFSMAVGHWVVSAWEDWKCRDSLGRALEKRALGCTGEPSAYLLKLYLSHHVVAIGGYLALLWLRRLAGIGAVGLLFELPVLLLNRRELALRRSPVPQWLRERVGVQGHWRQCYMLYVVGRGLPAALYAYAVLDSRHTLGELSLTELTVLHTLSLFFCAYNFLFLGVLRAWARFDLDAAAREAMADCDNTGASSSDSEDAKDEGKPVNPEAAPLREVTQDALAAMSGSGPGSAVWVAVDGVAYDVTGFLVGCPCGEQVLRKWGGRDASEAFHDAAHSGSAKEQMLRYMVGPIRYAHTEYRFMEHEEEEKPVHSILVAISACAFLKLVADSWLLSGTTSASGAALALGNTEIALLAFLLAAATGAISAGVKTLARPPPGPATPSAHMLAVGLLIWHFGFLASCNSAPRGLSAAAPMALELAAAALFVLEELVETSVARADRSVGFWGALLAVLYSWYSRAAAEGGMPELDPALGRWRRLTSRMATLLHWYSGPCAVALVLALSVSMIVRQVGWRRRSGAQAGLKSEWLAAAAAGAVQLSGVYGAFGAVAVAAWSPGSAERAASVLGGQPLRMVVLFVLASASALALLSALVVAASRCSPAFAARAAGFELAVAGLLCCGLGGRSWLTLVGFVAHLGGLASRNRARLRDAGNSGRFADLPPHVVGAQAVWDRFRATLGTSIWSLTVLQYRELVNAWLPRELRVFATDSPFPNLGGLDEKTYLGVAAHFAPRTVKGKHRPPQYCVCNVGQIYSGALADMQQTMNTLIDVWSEFQAPEMKGLLANLVAVFPDIKDQRVAKEINLSFWESAKDAHNWYVKSPGHKNALFQHTSGRLKTFGNLLASLELAGPMQHRDRCRQCARPVQSKELGGLAPQNCGVCGGPTFRHPLL